MHHRPLFLQAPPPGDAKPSEGTASQGFAPVEGGPELQSGEALLVEAYIVMWILVLGFVVLAYRRTIAFERRLGALEQAVSAVPGAQAGRGAAARTRPSEEG
jgi:hypothetical protein